MVTAVGVTMFRACRQRDNMTRAISAIAELLFSPACAGCGTHDDVADGFCPSCSRSMLSLVSQPYCPRCGSIVAPGLPQPREDCCPHCPAVMPRFERVTRVGPYSGTLKAALRNAKYRGTSSMLLSEMLAQAVAAQYRPEHFDLVLAVPMFWLRRLLRGQNFPTLLAGRVAAKLSWPLGHELVRVRNTPPQVRLSASRRQANVRGAFAVRDKKSIQSARVLLVDDVITTGATANEAARTLLDAGAAHVSLAVVAKAEAPKAYEHKDEG
jgi:ComF family protein